MISSIRLEGPIDSSQNSVQKLQRLLEEVSLTGLLGDEKEAISNIIQKKAICTKGDAGAIFDLHKKIIKVIKKNPERMDQAFDFYFSLLSFPSIELGDRQDTIFFIL